MTSPPPSHHDDTISIPPHPTRRPSLHHPTAPSQTAPSNSDRISAWMQHPDTASAIYDPVTTWDSDERSEFSHTTSTVPQSYMDDGHNLLAKGTAKGRGIRAGDWGFHDAIAASGRQGETMAPKEGGKKEKYKEDVRRAVSGQIRGLVRYSREVCDIRIGREKGDKNGNRDRAGVKMCVPRRPKPMIVRGEGGRVVFVDGEEVVDSRPVVGGVGEASGLGVGAGGLGWGLKGLEDEGVRVGHGGPGLVEGSDEGSEWS